MNIRESCDRLAEKYANSFWDETERKPFDQKMLNWLAEIVGGTGTICDLGCGSGQIARYLHRQGVKVCGIDLSIEMVKQARRLNPEILFQQGDMISLTEVPDNSYAGIVSFYSIVHIPDDQIGLALKEIYRIMQPGGALLLTYYVGREVVHVDELWGENVSVDFFLFETEEIKRKIVIAGLILEEVVERDPYLEIEPQKRHAYILARKPGHDKSSEPAASQPRLPL